eukprot:9440696-Pyramimonas_sp.AAC.1
MEALAEQLSGIAVSQGTVAARTRLAGFHKWAKETFASGPAQLFHLTRIHTWLRSQAQRHGELSTHPQAIADSQMDMWNGIWEGRPVTTPAGPDAYFASPHT